MDSVSRPKIRNDPDQTYGLEKNSSSRTTNVTSKNKSFSSLPERTATKILATGVRLAEPKHIKSSPYANISNSKVNSQALSNAIKEEQASENSFQKQQVSDPRRNTTYTPYHPTQFVSNAISATSSSTSSVQQCKNYRYQSHYRYTQEILLQKYGSPGTYGAISRANCSLLVRRGRVQKTPAQFPTSTIQTLPRDAPSLQEVSEY
ncbi:hypothetical protein IFR05_004372 [Cadophora sp. M221]|nr:hypothetical protein IFR05_004372 [Cadophora sp. M221]